MKDTLQSLVRAGRWAMDNTRAVAASVGAIALLGLGVLITMAVGAIPDEVAGTFVAWILAITVALYAYYLFGRAETLEGASEATPGAVSPDQGLVHVTGAAVPAAEGETVSPEGRDEEVLGYELKITREVKRGAEHRNDPILRTRTSIVKQESAVAPFYVEGDYGGRVLVDADHANLSLDWDEEPGMGREGLHWAALEAGDEITVVGTAKSPGDRDGSLVAETVSTATDAAQDQLSDFEDIQEAVQAQQQGDLPDEAKERLSEMEAGQGQEGGPHLSDVKAARDAFAGEGGTGTPSDRPTEAPDLDEAAEGLDEAKEKMREHFGSGTADVLAEVDDDVLLTRDRDTDILLVEDGASSADEVASGERWGAIFIAGVAAALFLGGVYVLPWIP